MYSPVAVHSPVAVYSPVAVHSPVHGPRCSRAPMSSNFNDLATDNDNN